MTSDPASLSRLYEFRLYRAVPGARSALVAMFEEVFLDAYEAEGAVIDATFVDLLSPDRWLWIRSFESPEARGAVLEQFYAGPVWTANSKACNRLIHSVEAAWLLRPVTADTPASAQAGVWSLEVQALALLAASAPGARVFETHTGLNHHPAQRVRRTPIRASLHSSKMVPPRRLTRSGFATLLQPTARSRLQ